MSSVGVQEFTVESVEKVYQSVKDTMELKAVYGVVAAIAILLMLQKVIAIYKEAYKSSQGRPDMYHFFELIWQYAFFTCIIVALPTIISVVEGLLSQMETGLLKITGNDITMVDKLAELIAEKNSKYPEGPSIMDGIMGVFDFFMCVIVSPLIYSLTSYTYALFLWGRYMYLLMLEIVAPIAVILFLNEKTQQYFYNWCKHMLVCYLMLPCFMLANLFADTYSAAYGNGEIIIWWTLILRYILKLYLFKQVNTRLNNLL